MIGRCGSFGSCEADLSKARLPRPLDATGVSLGRGPPRSVKNWPLSSCIFTPVFTRGWGTSMQSSVVKRSVSVGGHKTSLSLEDAFWNGLREIARRRNMTLSKLVEDINAGRTQSNLSSAIRLFVLGHYRGQIAPRHEPKQNGAAVALMA